MVDENLEHEDPEVIRDKMLVIGRVYSAAVTRGGGVKDDTKDGLPSNLYDHLAESIKKIGVELDRKIAECRRLGRVSRDNLKPVVETHSYLNSQIVKSIKAWRSPTVKGKVAQDVSTRISFVSKYLHFHAPMAVFIFDSIAQKNLRLEGLKGKRTNWPSDWNHNLHTAYATHCLRLLDYIKDEKYPDNWTPRLIDGHLLGYIKKN
jgi:hypothetical protein